MYILGGDNNDGRQAGRPAGRYAGRYVGQGSCQLTHYGSRGLDESGCGSERGRERSREASVEGRNVPLKQEEKDG